VQVKIRGLSSILATSPFSLQSSLTSEACDTRQGARHGFTTSGYVRDTLGLRLGQNKISHCRLPSYSVTDILKSSRSRNADAQRECLALTTLWTSSTEEKYMGRTAIAWGSASAHNLAAYSQSELGFATHFNMYPEVQLPSPNGSLGHTRGQVNCAKAQSKALINAGMPVYFFGTESRTSQMARPNPLDLTVCPTSDVMAFPLRIVRQLRY
jgi:hypothetical protein